MNGAIPALQLKDQLMGGPASPGLGVPGLCFCGARLAVGRTWSQPNWRMR